MTQWYGTVVCLQRKCHKKGSPRWFTLISPPIYFFLTWGLAIYGILIDVIQPKTNNAEKGGKFQQSILVSTIITTHLSKDIPSISSLNPCSTVKEKPHMVSPNRVYVAKLDFLEYYFLSRKLLKHREVKSLTQSTLNCQQSNQDFGLHQSLLQNRR